MPLVSNPVSIFLVVLAIILIVPMLLQRLKIPNVIGLILAGVAVGPFGFNILAHDMSFEVFGQVGLLYLMFLAGLEIDMYHLRKNLHKGTIFGFFTFIIPLILGFVAGRLFLHLGNAPSLLLAAMFSAHTLLAYPIVWRFGLTRSPAVVIAVAGTIVAVLGSLMVLAAVSDIARSGQFQLLAQLRLLVIIIVFAVAVMYLYPIVTRWFFRKYSDPITQFVYVLAMVFLAAAVARWIGIEGVFGAFLGGLVMNRFVPARSPLMSRLEFVGNALFIPYFLLGVGMLINLKVFTHGWNLVYIAAVITAVAMVSKWAAAWCTQKVCKLTSPDRSLLYQLTNAHTAVALAVTTIGYQMGLLDEEMLNAVVVMILLTCTVSSLGTERAARRLQLKIMQHRDTADHASADRPPSTLITVSNPLTTPQLVDLALMMRGPATPESPVYALHVRNENSPLSMEMAKASLELAEKTAAAVDSLITPIQRFDINVSAGITNTMAERGITELVIGMHRQASAASSFFGNIIEQLLVSTSRMVVLSRCFIPLNTISGIVVYVPPRAQFETGFARWVQALGFVARELGCRITFYCDADCPRLIKGVLAHWKIGVRVNFHTLDRPDDYVLLANKVEDDDLFVVITARRTSLSFNTEMDALPDFLRRYFSRNNLLIIYPEQYGEPSDVETMAANMSADFHVPPVPLLSHLRNIFRMKFPAK